MIVGMLLVSMLFRLWFRVGSFWCWCKREREMKGAGKTAYPFWSVLYFMITSCAVSTYLTFAFESRTSIPYFST